MLKKIIISALIVVLTCGFTVAQVDSLQKKKVYYISKKELATVVAKTLQQMKTVKQKEQFDEGYLRRLIIEKKILQHEMMKYYPMTQGYQNIAFSNRQLEGQLYSMAIQLQFLTQLLANGQQFRMPMEKDNRQPNQQPVIVVPQGTNGGGKYSDGLTDATLIKNQEAASKQLEQTQVAIRNLDSLYKKGVASNGEMKTDTVLLKQMKDLLMQNEELKKRMANLQESNNSKSYAPKYTGEIERVFFANGSRSLNAQAFESIHKAIKKMEENPSFQVMVKGFASKTGNSIFNQKLSARRTDAVKEALVRRGISPGRILSSYYGEDLETVDDAYGRRVEILFIDNGF